MANLEKIVDDLSSLTVMEAAELSNLLEEKWGVSAAAPVAVAAAGRGVDVGVGSAPHAAMTTAPITINSPTRINLRVFIIYAPLGFF